MSTAPVRQRTPWQVWAAALTLALLRSAPYIAVRFADPPAGRAFLPLGYIPFDWLQYVAFIRQSQLHIGAAMLDPFTTQAQDGRFILLFHQLLGALATLTGLDAFTIIELARIPALALFFWVLWRFLARVHAETSERLWALWLVALSGGLEFLVTLNTDALPRSIADTVRGDFWPMFGWSTFQAAYNPLWIVGLALLVPLLGAALDPTWSRSPRKSLGMVAGLLLLHLIHPYSAITVLAVVLLQPVLLAVLGAPRIRACLLATWPAFLGGLALIAGLAAWQMGDPVYRAASGGLWGLRSLAVFWYPITYGAVLFFAIRGWQRMVAHAHPWRFGLGAWTLAVIALHTSPILNGYHFLYFLHLPVAVVAAPAVRDTFARLRQGGAPGRLGALVLLVALFLSSLVVTVQAMGEAMAGSQVPADHLAVAQRLGREPTGNVLSSAELGNLVPALSADHVYVGHWFMTPGYEARKAEVDRLFGAAHLDAVHLGTLVQREHLRYVVLPRRLADEARVALADRRPREASYETLTLFMLGP